MAQKIALAPPPLTSPRMYTGRPMAQETILIVDDEVNVTELFSMMLEMEGYQVQVVHNVKAALGVLERGKPDLMLVDVMMPAASGLVLCRHVRSTAGLASLPIIILSAKSRLEEVQEGLRAGANLYLLKPVSKNELVQAVRKILSG